MRSTSSTSRDRRWARTAAALVISAVALVASACTWGSPGGMVVGSGEVTTTEVSGSRLKVETTSGFVSTDGVVVQVSVPSLSTVALSGGATASGAVGTVEDLGLELSGPPSAAGPRTSISTRAVAPSSSSTRCSRRTHRSI